MDDRAFADMASGPDDDMRLDDHIAFDHRVRRQEYGFGRDKGDAGLHRRVPQPALKRRLGTGQIHAVIDAHDIMLTDNDMGHRNAVFIGERDNVCQVIFALCIIVRDPLKPAEQRFVANGHDAAIAQSDLALAGAGIPVFHDPADTAVLVLYKPPVPGRIVRFKPCDDNAGTGLDTFCQPFQACGRNKRRIGKHDDRDPLLIANRITRRGDGIAGAQLVLLNGEGGAVKPALNVVRSGGQHGDDPVRARRTGGVDGPGKHGMAANPVKRLRQG